MLKCKEGVENALGAKTCSNLLFRIVLRVFARCAGGGPHPRPRPRHHDYYHLIWGVPSAPPLTDSGFGWTD